MYKLRFRQIHLDFHTSPAIPRIGAAFRKKQWQKTLKAGHVNSITCFSKCHHGWSYHPTDVGQMHPHLRFDLLRAQMDACREIDVNVPVYISAGVDNVASHAHPEWREVGPNGQYTGWARETLQPGFHKMCFNSPYLDFLCAQIRECVKRFPDANGIFLDIISQYGCCCRWCLDVMKKKALDPTREDDRRRCTEWALLRYYKETTAACRDRDAKMPVFHNSGHIPRGQRDILPFFSHLELESLPTGGWGYDHFPLSAKYVHGLGLDYMGMTGKFHTTWGEFGGFKHPNALRYECAAMLAYGSKCSVGDQLHPEGALDSSTYELIGAAYAEVEAKEPWCDGARSIADIGLLSAEACKAGGMRNNKIDDGAVRILLEGHFLFDVLDKEMDFNRYKMLILPDAIPVDARLKRKLDAYLEKGGKLFLNGRSGLDEKNRFAFSVGATCEGESPFQPDYILPIEDLRPDFCHSPMVMYLKSQRIRVKSGTSLGAVYEPYFNRQFPNFCSHQHTPQKPRASRYACGVQKGRVMYLAHPVFELYAGSGAVALKDYVVAALNRLLGRDRTVTTNLPSTGRVTLMEQHREKRRILHLLYAATINRGGPMQMSGGNLVRDTKSVEVIEDLIPLRDVTVSVRSPKPVTRASLEPQSRPIGFTMNGDRVELTVPELMCHQMVALE